MVAIGNIAMHSYSYIVRKVGNKPFYILGDILYALGIGILGSVLYANNLTFAALMSNNELISIALIVIGHAKTNTNCHGSMPCKSFKGSIKRCLVSSFCCL